MHTNLDLSESFGVNLCLANAVGLKNTRLCKSGECLFMGELDTDIESFAKTVKTNLNCSGLRYTNVKTRFTKSQYHREQAVPMWKVHFMREAMFCLQVK